MNAVAFLTRQDEVALGVRIASGYDQSAVDAMVLSHMPLVAKMARKFVRYGADRDDLMQSGAIGLNRAANRFDPAIGVRFSTYASWWIRAEMQLCVMGESVVHLGKTRKMKREFLHRGGPPTVSLDAPISGLGDSETFASVLPDTSDLPDQIAEKTIDGSRRLAALSQALDALDPRSRDIIRRRFLVEPPEKLDDVGEVHGISKERVRQIESRALELLKKKMRAP